MNKMLWKKAIDLSSRNYAIVVSKDEIPNRQTLFMAKNPELFGCMAQGYSIEDALQNLEEARQDFIYDLLSDGLDVPAPKSHSIFTGTQPSVNIVTVTDFSVTKNIDIDHMMNEETEVEERELLFAGMLKT